MEGTQPLARASAGTGIWKGHERIQSSYKLACAGLQFWPDKGKVDSEGSSPVWITGKSRAPEVQVPVCVESQRWAGRLRVCSKHRIEGERIRPPYRFRFGKAQLPSVPSAPAWGPTPHAVAVAVSCTGSRGQVSLVPEIPPSVEKSMATGVSCVGFPTR